MVTDCLFMEREGIDIWHINDVTIRNHVGMEFVCMVRYYVGKLYIAGV
jgi:hypothetical protein